MRCHRPNGTRSRYAADFAHHACITFTVVQLTRAPDNLHLQIGDGCALEGHEEGSFAALPEETTY